MSKRHCLTQVMIITILFIFICIEETICQWPEIASDVQFLYGRSGAHHVSRVKGHKSYEMQVDFNGDYEIYSFHEGAERILEKTGLVNEYQKDSLHYHFEEIGFLDFPDFLPKTREVRWPVDWCTVGYKKMEEDTIKVVRAIMTADHKYYPPGFLEFINTIESILFKGISRIE